MSLFHRYNNEDVLIRAVIAGLLDVVNNKIQYRQAWGDEDFTIKAVMKDSCRIFIPIMGIACHQNL